MWNPIRSVLRSVLIYACIFATNTSPASRLFTSSINRAKQVGNGIKNTIIASPSSIKSLLTLKTLKNTAIGVGATGITAFGIYKLYKRQTRIRFSEYVTNLDPNKSLADAKTIAELKQMILQGYPLDEDKLTKRKKSISLGDLDLCNYSIEDPNEYLEAAYNLFAFAHTKTYFRQSNAIEIVKFLIKNPEILLVRNQSQENILHILEQQDPSEGRSYDKDWNLLRLFDPSEFWREQELSQELKPLIPFIVAMGHQRDAQGNTPLDNAILKNNADTSTFRNITQCDLPCSNMASQYILNTPEAIFRKFVEPENLSLTIPALVRLGYSNPLSLLLTPQQNTGLTMFDYAIQTNNVSFLKQVKEELGISSTAPKEEISRQLPPGIMPPAHWLVDIVNVWNYKNFFFALVANQSKASTVTALAHFYGQDLTVQLVSHKWAEDKIGYSPLAEAFAANYGAIMCAGLKAAGITIKDISSALTDAYEWNKKYLNNEISEINSAEAQKTFWANLAVT